MSTLQRTISATVLLFAVHSTHGQHASPKALTGLRGLNSFAFGQKKNILLAVEGRYDVWLMNIKDGSKKLILSDFLEAEWRPGRPSIDDDCDKFAIALYHIDGRDATRIAVYSCDKTKLEAEFDVPGLLRNYHRGKLAFTVSKDKPERFNVVDVASRKVSSCDTPLKKIRHVVPSPDGKEVVALGHEALICYKVEGLEKTWQTPIGEGGLQLLWSPDGTLLALQLYNTTHLYDARSGKELDKLKSCFPRCFTPSGSRRTVPGRIPRPSAPGLSSEPS